MIELETDSDALRAVFRSWTSSASHFIGGCFELAKPFLDKEFLGIDVNVRFVSTQLFIDCHLTSETVLILIQNEKEWDADSINRSVIEGTLKYVYMLCGTEAEAKERVNEYWNILPMFAAIRDSDKAKRVLDEVPDPQDPQWQPFRDLLLRREQVEEIRQDYQGRRRQIEKKWSFFGLSNFFVQSGDPGLRLFGNLAHGYGMSSHLIHKDADGVGMVWERYQRDRHRRDAVRLGHSARVVSDVCIFAKLRLLYLLKLCKADTQCVFDLEKLYNDVLFSELEKAGKHFTNVEYGNQANTQHL